MKQFFRKTYVSDGVFNSNDTQIKRSITTEELLHEMITKGTIENTLKITQQNQVRNLEIKRICYGKPILFILLKKQVYIQQEEEKDFRKIQNQLIRDLQSIGRLHKQLLKELFNRIPLYSIGIIIFNSLKNCMLLLEQDKIFELSGFVQPLFLKQLVFSINPVFVNLSSRQNRKFFKIINLDDDFQLKLNLKFLIQILLNIFEFSLNHSKPQTTIILQITEEQSSDENLLKFIFTFSSVSEVQNPFTQQINEPLNITNQLLGHIGPNDNIGLNQMNMTTSNIRNEISFYTYQNQLENLTSYTKFISKESNNEYLKMCFPFNQFFYNCFIAFPGDLAPRTPPLVFIN
ncbi:hypothetical protein FGO68_gene9518 [Halteria grandinella]|uniref:Uncharacterized protein n=1 Tax=Halteria grandinella TaxID=5974 RepID=A0A8J8SWR7_HALGN|nr:hypothetical protein FGO68_gene9518 [Halteria grandinella]